jgi:hypothetical protein
VRGSQEFFRRSLSVGPKLKRKSGMFFLPANPSNGDQLRYPGELFYFCKIYPLNEAKGSIIKVVIFLEDITELTRLEEELKDSYVKLENAFQS